MIKLWHSLFLKILIIGGIGVQTAACTPGSFVEPEKLHIEMLDVGQGLAFLIKGRECSSLYDTGTPRSGIDTMLQNRGIKNLCTVIISHWHNDHAGGIPRLATMAKNGELQIGRVFFTKDVLLSGYAAHFRDSSLALLSEAHIAASEITRGDTLADFLPWTTRVLFPTGDSTLTVNPSSLAIRISDTQNGFLFMGDLYEKQEKQILELEPLLSAFALQVGHHGSRTSSSWDFLAQIQPKMALISAGRNNSYGHPHQETMAKLRIILQQDTTQIFRTDRDGSVEIEWLYRVGMWRK
ncbi:MAG: MBL fold metallo-hydrolase [Fibromonadaceae bacterium]|jgi:competence protein ComEC|nr:MBL fold metallo-hydrolase [Fibromonadaceae bacterium]